MVDDIERENDKFRYRGRIQKGKVIEFHKTVCQEPFTWKQLVAPTCEDGVPAFKCKICDIKKSDVKFFAKHASEHKDEELFSCRIKDCKAYFEDWEPLENHLICHCDGRTFFCGVCWAAYKHLESLNRHKQQKHGTEKKTNIKEEFDYNESLGYEEEEYDDFSDEGDLTNEEVCCAFILV